MVTPRPVEHRASPTPAPGMELLVGDGRNVAVYSEGGLVHPLRSKGGGAMDFGDLFVGLCTLIGSAFVAVTAWVARKR